MKDLKQLAVNYERYKELQEAMMVVKPEEINAKKLEGFHKRASLSMKKKIEDEK